MPTDDCNGDCTCIQAHIDVASAEMTVAQAEYNAAQIDYYYWQGKKYQYGCGGTMAQNPDEPVQVPLSSFGFNLDDLARWVKTLRDLIDLIPKPPGN